MTPFKIIPHAIQWHEGMLLVPQHFQQQDYRTSQLLSFYTKTFVPYCFGVSRFSVDPTRLAQGIVYVMELEAIMPNGVVLQYHDEYKHKPLELDITHLKSTLMRSPVMLYLCVPRHRPGESNVAGSLPHYVVQDDDVVDENTADGDHVTVPRLIPNMGIVMSDLPPTEDFISLPLGKIVWENDLYGFTAYIPPMVNIERGTPLYNIAQAIVNTLRDKISSLHKKYDAQSRSPIDQALAQSMTGLMQATIPLEAALRADILHPFTLYRELCHVIANLSCFTFEKGIPVIAPYDHYDPWGCFSQLLDDIKTIMHGMNEHYNIVPFERKNNIFGVKLPQPWPWPRIVVGAAISPDQNDHEIVTWMKNSIIASESFVQSVCDRRTLGAHRTMIQRNDPQAPRTSRDIVLFHVDISPQFINQGEAIYIFNPTASEETRPLSIYLFIDEQPKGSL